MTARKSLTAKIHIAKKDMGLDDDNYQDLLVGVTGVSSSKKMSVSQMTQVMDKFHEMGWRPVHKKSPAKSAPKKRPQASSAVAKKMRALWIALYDLGVVNDNSEAALASYAKRLTGGKKDGIEALQWIKGGAADKVIESLKSWAHREARVNWESYPSRVIGAGEPVELRPWQRVIEAQWRILLQLGAIRHPDHLTVEMFGYRVTGKSAFHFYESADFNTLQKALGAMIRKRKNA